MLPATDQLIPKSRQEGEKMETYKMWIGGQWVDADSGKTFRTYNPATGEVVAEVPLGGPVRRGQGCRGRSRGAAGVAKEEPG